jgi:hypothetical protein
MTADGTNSGAPLTSFIARLSAYAANALRYWEPRGLIYNGLLALVGPRPLSPVPSPPT